MRILRNNTFYKFVMSFVILVCISIGTLGSFAYQSSKKIVMQRFDYQQQELLKHLSAGVQEKITVINEVTLLVSMDSRISKAYFYKKNNRIENIQNYREIVNYLKGLSSSIDDVLSINIQYNMADVVISQDGKFSIDMFYNKLVNYSGMNVQDWKQLPEKHKNFSLIHSGSVNIGGHKERTLTFGRTLPYDNTARPYAFVAITVAEEFFYGMISPDVINQNANTTIVKNGEILLTTAKHMSDEMREEILGYSGDDEISFDGKTFVVSTLTDGFSDWQYISTIPKDEVIRSINNFKVTILLIILMVLFLGFVLSFFLAKRLYRPISEIVRGVSGFSDSDSKNDADDFKMIRLGISSILTEKDGLKNELELKNTLLRTNAILNIINGRRDIIDSKNGWAELGIYFPFKWFQIIITQENVYQESIDSVINEVMKLYRDELKLYVVTKDGYCIMLCNYMAESETDTKIYDFAKKLEDATLGAVIGVGKAYLSLEDVCQSYLEAVYAIRNSGVSAGIVSAENISQTENMKKGYSIEDEQKLMWAVKNGDLKSVDSLLEELMTLENPMIYSALTLTAYKIAVSYSLLQNNNEYNFLVFPSGSPETVKERIMQQYHALIEHFSKGENERYYGIFLKIKEKIDNDFTQEISLQQLGDEIGYSASYLSFIFKEVAKVNYLDYMNNLRIDLAKKLLIETDLPLIDIAVKVGYNNTVTLNRLFKKFVGTTPGKYRESNL